MISFKDKILLITGGTGSFGNAVLRRFLTTDIAEIRILSRDEKKQDDMRHTYQELYPQHAEKIKFYIGDVRDYNSILNAFRGVDYVFHAAALKQVPSCEFYPMEAVKTNVAGSDNVISACVANHVKKAIFLSTDKAAYPINAMGMTKAVMEKNVIARSRQMLPGDPVLCLTRYGNVMASRGSVIPLFCDRIDEGKPLTITNPNMTRFMMTLSDAVDLVLYAFEHGEQGDLFVQKAPAATIETLAQAVLELKHSDLGTTIIGTRHGEKLFEVLVTAEEMMRAEDLPGFFRIPADNRDLNYDNYFSKGNPEFGKIEQYTSHNTHRLNVEEMKQLLLKLKLFGGNLLMNVLITGANGFVGKNLTQRLSTIKDRRDRTRPALQIEEILLCTRDTSAETLAGYCQKADFVVHLAGVNRPQDPGEFAAGNTDFTRTLLEMLRKSGNRCPVLLSSSIQASLTGRYAGSPYGQSKKAAEELLLAYGEETGAAGMIYRLPNLFGKWCRPNYNSAVATFCHHIAREEPITVSDPAVELELVYIDDLIDEILDAMEGQPHRTDGAYCSVPVSHRVTLGEIVRLLQTFHDQPQTLLLPEIPEGSFEKKLYSTYLSYLPPEKIAFPLKMNVDERGSFTELLKTEELRSGLCEHFKARYRQGAALAQQQVGVLHGRGRTRADPGTPNRLR